MQGPLPLILLAAEMHPDLKFKQSLWKKLDDWLNIIAPTDANPQIQRILKNERGTFLEPFVLGETSLKTATFLIRLALFNINTKATRFRTCSDTTIGNSGGLVITNNLASFYSEEFILGKNRLLSSSIRFYAPYMRSMIPLRDDQAHAIKAHVDSDDDGLYIIVNKDLVRVLNWAQELDDYSLREVTKQLAKSSTIGDEKISVSKLGLSFSVINEGIKIAPKSPEAMIRFSSYLVQGQQIHLSGYPNYDLRIALPKIGHGNAPITVVANDGFALPWMDIDDLGAPNLDAKQIKKICDWAFEHSHWQNNPVGE